MIDETTHRRVRYVRQDLRFTRVYRRRRAMRWIRFFERVRACRGSVMQEIDLEIKRAVKRLRKFRSLNATNLIDIEQTVIERLWRLRQRLRTK